MRTRFGDFWLHIQKVFLLINTKHPKFCFVSQTEQQIFCLVSGKIISPTEIRNYSHKSRDFASIEGISTTTSRKPHRKICTHTNRRHRRVAGDWRQGEVNYTGKTCFEGGRNINWKHVEHIVVWTVKGPQSRRERMFRGIVLAVWFINCALWRLLLC